MRPMRLQEPFRAVFYAPFYCALARGDYAAEGVEVQLLPGEVPSLAKDAVLEGRAELAWGGPMRVLLAHGANPASPLRNFGAVVLGDPFFLVGRAPRPGFSLRDLAGLKLGTVSEVPTPWWTLQQDIRAAGLDPTSIARVTDQPMAANLAAVAAGTLDVAQVFEPLVSQMEEQGSGHIWHAASSRGPTAYTTFISTAEKLQSHRAEFKAMLRGLARTLRWFSDATPEQVAVMIADRFPDLPPTRLQRCIARYKAAGLWTRDPHFPREPWDRLEHAMFTAGAIPREPGYENCVDDAIVTEALA